MLLRGRSALLAAPLGLGPGGSLADAYRMRLGGRSSLALYVMGASFPVGTLMFTELWLVRGCSASLAAPINWLPPRGTRRYMGSGRLIRGCSALLAAPLGLGPKVTLGLAGSRWVRGCSTPIGSLTP